MEQNHNTREQDTRIFFSVKDLKEYLNQIGDKDAVTITVSIENDKDRLVYHIEGGRIYIVHCRGHYGDK